MQLLVALDEARLLHFVLGAAQDQTRSREGQLEVLLHAVSDVVVHHLLVVADAAEGMVAPAVMSGPAPAAWEIGRVKHWEAKLAQEGNDEEVVLDPVAWDTAAHGDEGV